MTGQQHCEHECVCPDYKASHSDWEEDPDPCDIPCYHRSRPAPAAPSPDCMKCTKHADGYCLGKEDAAATIRNELVSDILTRITEAQYDKSTMQDFINYVESLRSTSSTEANSDDT